MKKSLLLLLCAMLVVAVGVTALADQKQVKKSKDRQPEGIPVEFTDNLDKEHQKVPPPPPNDIGLPDPAQTLYVEPIDGAADAQPFDGWDYQLALAATLYPFDSIEVDAMANLADADFEEVVNPARFTRLYVSIQTDPQQGGAGNDVPVWFEGWPRPRLVARRGVKWFDNEINAVTPANLEDLDAIELWGPLPGFDANRFSLVGDEFDHSVWWYDPPAVAPPNGAVGLYITQTAVHGWVTALGFGGAVTDVDLDGLMIYDAALDNAFDPAHDEIIFSIRGGVGGWDGGEIVYRPAGGPPQFLLHGGHRWNTAFDVRTAFNQAVTEEIDAIEAEEVPALTDWGMLVLAAMLVLSALWVYRTKRNAQVTAR
jgi:hypothetical protein